MRKLFAMMIMAVLLTSVIMAFEVSQSFTDGIDNRKSHVATYNVSSVVATNAVILTTIGKGSAELYLSFYSSSAVAQFTVTMNAGLSFSNDFTNTNVYTNGSTNGQTWTYGDMQSPNLSYATGYAKLCTTWLKLGGASAWDKASSTAVAINTYNFAGAGWHTVPVPYIITSRNWYVIAVSNSSAAGSNANITIVPQIVFK